MVQEIECSVKYQDLIEDTLKGLLSTVRYDLGKNEELLLTGKSGMDSLGAHNALHQLGYASIYKMCLCLAKIWLISSNIRQKLAQLGEIDTTAVHRICCSMTNTYNTHLDHSNCYRYKLYQYFHIFIFPQPQFLMGVGLNI